MHQEVVTTLYTLFEHEALPYKWEQRHQSILERIRVIKGAEVLSATMRSGQRVLQAHQYVGTVRLGADTVTIFPKIDYGEEGFLSATRNLLYMLDLAGYIPPHDQTLAPMLERNQDWFELLTRIYATELLGQWRRGPHSFYQLVENNVAALKGKWRVDQQLRQPARDHRFDVVFDEFTPDNQLSRVFRYVTEQLWLRTRDISNRRLLAELRQWLDPVTLVPHMSADAIPKGIINRLNQRFEPVLNLSRLFLSEGSLELAPGELQSFAFVFDMNQLFEEFIIAFISRYSDVVLPESLQGCTLHPQTRQHARHLAWTGGGQRVFLLKPDLAFRQRERFPLLLDTKYKTLAAEDLRLGISQSDFYQMFAYAHRYQTPHVMLIYPQTSEPLRTRFQLAGHSAVISAVTVNLHRDFGRPEHRRALAREIKEIIATELTDGTDF